VRAAAIAFLLSTVAPAAIRFDSFASTQGLSLVGDATTVDERLRLTHAKGDRAGAAWFEEKQTVASGFETTFEFQLTHNGGMGRGADGFAFVVQKAGPDALGGRGSAGGFAVTDPNYRKTEAAIPWSIAVFFDTFRNNEEGDPSANYVAFCTYGRPSDAHWPAPRLAYTPHLPIHLKDHNVHTARIIFQPPVLSVFLDGAARPALEAPVDFSVVVDPQGRAWVGFTASTGGGYENHDILTWTFGTAKVSSNMSVVSSDISFAMSECLPGRNLCTPERAFVAPNGARYHVVLPANAEWGASVENPHGAPVAITNAHGIACWDVKARGSAGCSGPSGAGDSAGPGFLVPGAPSGALVNNSRGGRTWFSVNGSGGTFEANEGFYEFDVELTEPRP
jgi:hypothetical protein